MVQLKKLGCIMLLALLSAGAQANYQLDNAESSLNFISIKKDKIGEINTFTQLSGGIDKAGVASVVIELTSVQTNIDIRNERLKSLLFETGVFPTANVSAKLDVAQLKALKTGDKVDVAVALTLELHGKSKVIDTVLQVVALNNGALLVSTVRPILINAFDFTLNAGVEKLMEVAKLPSISTAVPVTFSVIFRR